MNDYTAYTAYAQALQQTFDHEIPITLHIGMRVVRYDGSELALAAPLEPNINHKATTFAGSLNSVVTLAGWGLIWLLLKEAGMRATIVIQNSETQYRRPVTRDFLAICRKPDEAQLDQFLRMLREKGKARLELQAEIREHEKLAVSFQGRYVAYTGLMNGR
jgi:thioesterase domain-containing protein